MHCTILGGKLKVKSDQLNWGLMEMNLAIRAHQPESMKTPNLITIDYTWLPIVVFF